MVEGEAPRRAACPDVPIGLRASERGLRELNRRSTRRIETNDNAIRGSAWSTEGQENCLFRNDN